jgi:hypothetical protein
LTLHDDDDDDDDFGYDLPKKKFCIPPPTRVVEKEKKHSSHDFLPSPCMMLWYGGADRTGPDRKSVMG